MKIVKSTGNILIGLCLILAVVIVLKADAGQPDFSVGMQDDRNNTEQTDKNPNNTKQNKAADGEPSDRDNACLLYTSRCV